ncbi:GTP 3',8-cyclase MoaA [Tissierella praeacuta]|uniref:GTP 3',8-cyclase MoaA n=1 Tax=Tissierella praeacuta TaxID=43131 RepID=UPI000EE5A94A|nr:GTP 3',8-cyclase MoaA [Tissierella praeacuta]MBU5256864.1 GTP 3',8-cyclase MoaA [Tissierella praeacuta]HAE91030.1 GTP 3',8-cyclase MoaA [Tissierella sp.]
MKDSFGREINYLRISLTDRCNLRCIYCMPEKGVSKFSHEEILTLEEVYEITKVFVELGVNKIRFTGGEPLIRKGIIDLIYKVSKLDGVKDLAMTTNGILLKEYAKELKKSGLNRVNISLDTLDEEKYSLITRGGKLKNVLEGIEEAKKVGLTPIKINTVLIGGFNDDEIESFIGLTEKEDINIRFIELMPIGEAAGWAKEKFISNDIILEKVKELIPIPREDKSSPAAYYKLPNGKGKVGIINPISCKFCANCNRVRLTSKGSLKLCLHSNREIDIKEALKSGQDMRKLIIDSINQKEESHHLEDGKYISRNMNQIGG